MTNPYAKKATQLILEDQLPVGIILDAATFCSLFSINEEKLENVAAILMMLKQKWTANGI